MNNITIKKVSPTFNGIITTAEKYKEDVLLGGSIINTKKMVDAYRDYQRVVAVGPSVRGMEVGDLVHIDFSRFQVRRFKENSIRNDDPTIQHMDRDIQYQIPSIEMNGEEFFHIHDNDIDYIITDYEEYKETSLQGVQTPKIITN